MVLRDESHSRLDVVVWTFCDWERGRGQSRLLFNELRKDDVGQEKTDLLAGSNHVR